MRKITQGLSVLILFSIATLTFFSRAGFAETIPGHECENCKQECKEYNEKCQKDAKEGRAPFPCHKNCDTSCRYDCREPK